MGEDKSKLKVDGIHGGLARAIGNQVSFAFPNGQAKMIIRTTMKAAMEKREPFFPEGMQVAFIEKGLVHIFMGSQTLVFDEQALYKIL